MPETTIRMMHVATGGKNYWSASCPEEHIIDWPSKDRITDMRCAMDWKPKQQQPQRVGSLWIVRNDDRSVSFKATPDRPDLRWAYRIEDAETGEGRLVGDIELFDVPYHDEIDIKEARRILTTRIFGND